MVLKRLRISQLFLVSAVGLEALAIFVSLLPLGGDDAAADATRCLALGFITMVAGGLGLLGLWLARRRSMLAEPSLCLLLLVPLHIIAAGTEPKIIWLPMLFGLSSVMCSSLFAWRHA